MARWTPRRRDEPAWGPGTSATLKQTGNRYGRDPNVDNYIQVPQHLVWLTFRIQDKCRRYCRRSRESKCKGSS